jgi:hypothetical protein
MMNIDTTAHRGRRLSFAAAVTSLAAALALLLATDHPSSAHAMGGDAQSAKAAAFSD